MSINAANDEAKTNTIVGKYNAIIIFCANVLKISAMLQYISMHNL